MSAPASMLREAEVLVNIDTQRDGRIRAQQLNEVLSPIRITLRDLDHVLERRVHRPEWDIRAMRQQGRHLRLILTPDYGARVPGTLDGTAAALIGGLDALRTVPELPPAFNAGVVERIQKLGAITDITAVRLEIADDRRTVVDQATSLNAAKATAIAQRAFGSAHGILDTMTARSKFQCQVYDRATRRSVRVRAADESMEAQLRDAFGQDVLVWGELTRNAFGQPLNLFAQELQLREFASRPLAEDLLGTLTLPPNASTKSLRDEARRAI